MNVCQSNGCVPQDTGRLTEAALLCERLLDVGGPAKERAKALGREVAALAGACCLLIVCWLCADGGKFGLALRKIWLMMSGACVW